MAMNKGSGRGLDPEVVAELDRQYKAMEQSMKSYVDQRTAARAETSTAAPRRDQLWLIPIAIVALAAIGLAAWPYVFPKRAAVEPLRNIEAPVTGNEPETTTTDPPPAPRADPVREAIASGAADGQWAVSLKNLMEQHGSVVATAMRSANRAALGDFAQRIERGQRLTQAERGRARLLLLESIAEVKADANLRDITPEVLSRLRGTYSVTTRSTDKNDIDLQSEIILRWMEVRAR